MYNNAPLDENLFFDEKKNVRNRKIKKIESWGLGFSGILLSSTLYYYIPYLAENLFWSTINLLSAFIPFIYLFWWRKISIAYTISNNPKFVLPDLFKFLRLLFTLNIIWDLIGLSNVYYFIRLYLSSSNMPLIYPFFQALNIGLIVLSIYHLIETRKTEELVR